MNAKVIEKKPVGRCNFCGRTSEFRCRRCSDFYCSPVCQKHDWEFHRLYCFPMPHLISSRESNKVSGQSGRVGTTGSNNQKKAIPTGNPSQQKQQSANVAKTSQNSGKSVFENNYKCRLQEIECRDGSIVILCSFRSFNRVYIRSANAYANELYQKQLEVINRIGRTSRPIEGRLEKNDIVLMAQGDKIYRAEVLQQTSANAYRIQQMETGIILERTINTLLASDDRIKHFPILIKQVMLEGLSNIKLPALAFKTLSHYEGHRYRIVYRCNNGPMIPTVSLIHIDNLTGNLNERLLRIQMNNNNNMCTNEHSNEAKQVPKKDDNSVVQKANNTINPRKQVEDPKTKASDNTPIATSTPLVTNVNLTAVEKEPAVETELGNNLHMVNKIKGTHLQDVVAASFKELNITTKPCLVPPFKIVRFNEGDKNKKMFVVDNTNIQLGYVGCIPVEHLDNLVETQVYLVRKFKDDAKPYTPTIKEYCVAKFDNEWYRAQVIATPETDRFTVIYIDFSNEKTIGSDEIRPYPLDLTTPCYSACCLIDGLTEFEMTEELLKYLKEILSYQEQFMIDVVVSAVEDCILIKSSTIISKVKDYIAKLKIDEK